MKTILSNRSPASANNMSMGVSEVLSQMADGVFPPRTACSEGPFTRTLLITLLLAESQNLTLAIHVIHRQVDKCTILLPLSLTWMEGLSTASHGAHQDASAHCSGQVWGFWGLNPQGRFSTSQPLLAASSRGTSLQIILGSSCLGLMC